MSECDSPLRTRLRASARSLVRSVPRGTGGSLVLERPSTHGLTPSGRGSRRSSSGLGLGASGPPPSLSPSGRPSGGRDQRSPGEPKQTTEGLKGFSGIFRLVFPDTEQARGNRIFAFRTLAP